MTTPHADSASYEVGYGKPPRRTQFKKGQSGNPGGRPRGRTIERLKELALQEAYRTVIVREDDGRAMPLSAIQAVLRSQLQIAASGNIRAQCAVLSMIRDLEFGKAVDAQFSHRLNLVNDAAADHDVAADDDDADYDRAADDDGEPARQPDEIDTDETCADEIDTDAEMQQEERERSASPPSSADGVLQPENAATTAAKLPAAKSLAARKPPRAAARVRKDAAKRRVRRERGRSARTAAVRKTAPKATLDSAASPGLQVGGTPALRPSVA